MKRDWGSSRFFVGLVAGWKLEIGGARLRFQRGPAVHSVHFGRFRMQKQWLGGLVSIVHATGNVFLIVIIYWSRIKTYQDASGVICSPDRVQFCIGSFLQHQDSYQLMSLS